MTSDVAKKIIEIIKDEYGINLALVGASGVVGGKIISLCEKKNLNINNFYPLGSSSVGKEVSLNNKNFIIEDLSSFDSYKSSFNNSCLLDQKLQESMQMNL
jgi:aspartate-semialdehyde dehydrogenase